MAHHNTILSQVLQLVKRHDFDKIEQAGFRPARKYRKLSRWSQFVTMLYAQITSRTSLRDLEAHFAVHKKRLYHVGAAQVRRSTLADANNKRPAEFYEALFEHLYQSCRPLAPKHKFRFKNPLYSMDATVINLCADVFSWAHFTPAKGGIKAHTVLDHDGYIPAFVEITDAKTSDLAIARTLSLPHRSILVVDRAYIDFEWFGCWHRAKNFFVTRIRKDLRFKVIERRKPNKSGGVTSDQVIRLTGKKSGCCPFNLRRIGFRDPKTNKHLVFLTNNLKLSAQTIADIYKDRWQIELFFKWIKQHLKIKSFFGTSKNAVMTQIYIAMITVLLLAYYKWLNKLGHSLSQILTLLQGAMFERRNLYEFFKPPSQPKPTGQRQIALNFSSF